MSGFDIIVAMDSQRGIGKNGTLPWHLPADLKYFKTLTTQTTASSQRNAVIMGRKTWESLPDRFRPLPDRTNIVLTRNPGFEVPPGVKKFEDLDEALATLRDQQASGAIGKIFVIGGEQIFRLAVEHPGCRVIHLTEIEGSFDCDTSFPEFEASFIETSRTPAELAEGIQYSFVKYERK